MTSHDHNHAAPATAPEAPAEPSKLAKSLAQRRDGLAGFNSGRAKIEEAKTALAKIRARHNVEARKPPASIDERMAAAADAIAHDDVGLMPEGDDDLEIPSIEFPDEDDGGGPPPIDCRAPWSPQAVIISDTTAVLLAKAFNIARERRLLTASDRAAAEVLQRAFDEVELIDRDVASLPAFDAVRGE